MSRDDDRPNFLSRWSERKRAVAEADELEAAAIAAEEAPTEGGALEEVQDPDAITAEELEELEKIDIESLNYDSDFTPFMKKGVPDLLRQTALRQLWRSNPILANLDGMNEYDENFNITHKVLENIQTAYKVGDGYLTKAERAALNGETLPEEEIVDEALAENNVEDADIEVAETSEISENPEAQEVSSPKDNCDISDHPDCYTKGELLPEGMDDLDDEEFA